MERSWSLYNKVEKIRIDDLRVDQVHTILLAIASNRMADWFACQEGDLRWQNILDIAEFYEDTHEQKGEGYVAPAPKPGVPPSPKTNPAQTAPAPDPRRPLFEDAPLETHDNSTLAMDIATTQERRSARRYKKKLKFRAIYPGGSFDCETSDISMAGMSLDKDLPPEIAKTFRAELKWNNGTIKILCSKVSERQLKLIEADAWDVLRHWIVSW